jgi:hypothetical protein
MDDLVITGAVANRVTACASQELGAGDQALRTAIAQRPDWAFESGWIVGVGLGRHATQLDADAALASVGEA